MFFKWFERRISQNLIWRIEDMIIDRDEKILREISLYARKPIDLNAACFLLRCLIGVRERLNRYDGGRRME
jgi:hypothetical protein